MLGVRSKNYRAIWRFIISRKKSKGEEKVFPFRSALFILLIASRLSREWNEEDEKEEEMKRERRKKTWLYQLSAVKALTPNSSENSQA